MKILNKKGFTILETVVVVVIIAAIATISNFSFRAADRGTVLNSAVEQFINDYEKMRSNAINGVFLNNTIQPNAYGIFTDFNDLGIYFTFIDYNPGDFLKSVGEQTEIVLPDGIQISSPNDGTPDIAFELFSADFYFEGLPSTQSIFFVLTDTKTADTKTITINQDGLIVEGASCGDGIPQAGEECEDGNAASNDRCSSICKIEWCGDAILQDQVRPRYSSGANMIPGDPLVLEQCDKANSGTWNNTIHLCSASCQLVVRGGGGGGCMIVPYSPSTPYNTPGAQNQFFLFLLLPIPFIVKLLMKRMDKIKVRDDGK